MPDPDAAWKIRHAGETGLTLVQLAIILVMIGVGLGVFMVAQNMVRIAGLHAQLDQIQQYDAAYRTFKLKYNCVPGDCADAASYWPGVVNGNGDGMIENNLSTFYGASKEITWAASSEYKYFFIELGLAHLVDEKFDGSPRIGGGLPALKYKRTSSFFASDTQSFFTLSGGRNPDMSASRRGTNALWFTACDVVGPTPSRWDADCGIFQGADMKDMDQKIDDGLPLSGRFYGFGGTHSVNNCLNKERTDYDIGRATRECLAAYILE